MTDQEMQKCAAKSFEQNSEVAGMMQALIAEISDLQNTVYFTYKELCIPLGFRRGADDNLRVGKALLKDALAERRMLPKELQIF